MVTRADRTYADVSLGLDMLKTSGTNLRVEYSGQFSDSSSANAIGVKLSMPF